MKVSGHPVPPGVVLGLFLCIAFVFALIGVGQRAQHWGGLALRLPPLHAAARDGDARKVRRLLSEGARVDEPDGQGLPPLWYALMGEHYEIAERLVAAGADVNARVLRPHDDLPLVRVAERSANQKFEESDFRRRAGAAAQWLRRKGAR